jgi:hypothetical protein
LLEFDIVSNSIEEMRYSFPLLIAKAILLGIFRDSCFYLSSGSLLYSPSFAIIERIIWNLGPLGGRLFLSNRIEHKFEIFSGARS